MAQVQNYAEAKTEEAHNQRYLQALRNGNVEEKNRALHG